MKLWKVDICKTVATFQYVMAPDEWTARRVAEAAPTHGHEWEADGRPEAEQPQEVSANEVSGYSVYVADGKGAKEVKQEVWEAQLEELERQRNTPGYRAYQERIEAEGQMRLVP